MAALGLILLFAGAAGCREVEGGAVSFRWFLMGRSSGTMYDPLLHAGEGGACCPNGDCKVWTVSRVRLVVRDLAADALIDLPADHTTFRCDQREAITPFSIPPGTHALSLRALLPGDADLGTPDVDQAVTPPPIVREVRRGVVVDLEFIEIAVEPLPLP